MLTARERPRPAQALTLAALDAWAAMPNQSPAEQVERQRLVALIKSTSSLTVLPEGPRVGGDLDLSGYTSLTTLPAGLRVGGSLYFSGCTSLASLPESLSVGGDLDLFGCTSLTGLPQVINLGGDLDLGHCTSLRRLPEGLRVGKDLNLFMCTSLTRLPEELRVRGSLELSGCTSLKKLPKWLRVRGGLELSGCTSLRSLPEGLRVRGDLELLDCTSLRRLPEQLSVGGGLNLFGCTSLTRLPKGLRVGGDLSLFRCTSLRRLPEELRVGGDLNLIGCSSLTVLPEAILRWPPKSNGQPHRIDITDSGIPAAAVASIQHAVGEGVQVVFGAGRESDAQTGFVNLDAARAFWQSLAGDEPEADDMDSGRQPGSIAAQPHQLRNLLDFLARLRDTADFHNPFSRPLLARRALDLLHRMHGSFEVAAMCHERIGQALESCGDRVIWAMNQLELALRVREAQTSTAPAAALRSLGTAMLRLEVMHRHAADKCAELPVVDPIEVYLAYETALAGPLQLPLSAQGMLYAQLSQVTDSDIELARQAAKRTGDDAQQVEAFLSAWEPWQVHLRRTHTADVEGVWRALVPVPAPVPVADDDRCVFTLESLAELRAGDGYPVAIASAGGQWQLYDLASLLVWYREHGTHPIDAGRQLRLEDIRSLPVV